MLNQALEIFEKEYTQQGDNLILGTYIPKDGTYVVVKAKANEFIIADTIEIKLDKKTRTIDRTQSKYMDFVCLADYYSKITDINKSILPSSGKVIQSNNYLSFIIKKDSLTNGKLTNDIIDKYYSFLEDPRLRYPKKTKAKSLELYEIIESKINEVDKERVDQIKNWIKENLFEKFKDCTGKDYLKIFFCYSEEGYKTDYKNESDRYFIPNIYNSNDYNCKIKGVIHGLPNDNMGLNAKKPYLETKTRKTIIPYYLNQEEIMMQKKFFDYLMNQAVVGKVHIYMGQDGIKALNYKEHLKTKFDGLFFRIQNGKEVEIHDSSIVTNFNPELRKKFEFQNILRIDDKYSKTSYESFQTLEKLQEIIDSVLFSRFLNSNYFTEASDIKINDSTLKSNILVSRTALFNWFYKGNSNNIWQLLNQVSLKSVKGSIENGYNTKAIEQFNLRMSLKEYFRGGKEMADIILNLKENLKLKITQEPTGCIENDREYFFAVGQLVSYLISRSKGKKKPLSLANPFINAKKDKIIKEKLKGLYKKYNYDIEDYNYRFKTMYAMVASYEIEDKIDEDMIIAGYLHSNLMYEKLESKEIRGDED